MLFFEAHLIYMWYKFHLLNLEKPLLNFLFKYMKRNLCCINDHHIVVCFLIVELLMFSLVYIDYKLLGRLDLNSILDVFWCKFVLFKAFNVFNRFLDYELFENPNGLVSITYSLVKSLKVCIELSRSHASIT